jgi:hypothetical protein
MISFKLMVQFEYVFRASQPWDSLTPLKLVHAVRDRWPPVHIVATLGHYAIQEGDLPDVPIFLTHIPSSCLRRAASLTSSGYETSYHDLCLRAAVSQTRASKVRPNLLRACLSNRSDWKTI